MTPRKPAKPPLFPGTVVQRIPEQKIPGKRLGRHVRHDPRSLGYQVKPRAALAKTVLWSRTTPVLDQGSTGSCFPPGTSVRMADGSERPIEAVRLGERVVTGEGGTGRVVRTLLRDEDGGLMRLSLWGHSHLRMTREHPILTERGYVPASELRVGDKVGLPKYVSGQNTHVSPADYVTQATHRLVRGNRWQGIPGRASLRAGAHELPEKIELDAQFGRLIGLFLAEGNCDSCKAVWTFHIKERDTYAADVAAIMSTYGVTVHTRDLPEHNSHKVTVHGAGWTRLLSALCGNGAGMKRMHPHLTAGPPEFLAAVFKGWRDGDGHQRTHRADHTGITISHDLALNMYDIAQALGHRPVIRHVPPVKNNAARVRQWRWEVATASGDSPLYSTQDDTHVWRKVRALHVEEYVGPVYDLTVEGDHSYVAEGVGVHNCTGNAMVGVLGSDPYYATITGLLTADPVQNEAEAINLYSAATGLDTYRGQYPPTDTGSDGLSVAKAAQQAGLISGYLHCTSIDAVVTALQSGPVISGVNWYASFDQPGNDGMVGISPGAEVRGGHEFEINGADMETKTFHAVNSWGDQWGHGGTFSFSFDTYARLLAEDGDATAFVPRTQSPPQPKAVTPNTVDVEFARTVGVSCKRTRPYKLWASALGL